MLKEIGLSWEAAQECYVDRKDWNRCVWHRLNQELESITGTVQFCVQILNWWLWWLKYSYLVQDENFRGFVNPAEALLC